EFGWHLVPLNQRGGIQDEGSTADSLRFETVQDYEDWIARMRAFPIYMDQTIALMRAGMDRRIVHPQVVMQRVPDQIASQIVDDPTEQLFYKPFRELAEEISPAEGERLQAEAKTAIEEAILPSYRKFRTFFQNEYFPACFEEVGAWQLPNGRGFYAQRCRLFTTTKLTPDQIHEIGLREVERIRTEMEAIVREVEFDGTFAEFLEHLRTEPKYYYDNGDQLLRGYLEICKKVDPQLVKLFKRLPRMPYGVEAIPEYIAPDTTTAYYRPPAADGTRAGTYFVNLYRPEVRPKYEMEALSLHEAVPGHHLQIALAHELDTLPRFRRYEGYTAFVEGWALYAESLGEELGLYQDPYSRFGQLTYEMWRAVRLVVDTGMHHKRWTRQQAIDFFAENTAKTLHDIENEIDRYIAWPGQALAYKIGELKIQELRREAKQKLGDQFDIREFHDAVLKNGAVTLDLLEEQIDAWIESVQQ
ncbi:MAG: DUF885 domain-containing protein, partial [Planctomycetaceae bacterium]|nr:DUF885 domain-containing protein [Planctomycetaceae bacterium]